MYNFVPPAEGGYQSPSVRGKGTAFPFTMVALATLVFGVALLIAIDEGYQFDPAAERRKLEARLQSNESSFKDVAARKSKIEELVKKAEAGTIPEERLPPIWQAPFSFRSIDEWRAAAKRRLKRCDEEMQSLQADTDRTQTELVNLPPDEAKRTPLWRRLLHRFLGDIPERTDD